jgi:hypothetical protein
VARNNWHSGGAAPDSIRVVGVTTGDSGEKRVLTQHVVYRRDDHEKQPAVLEASPERVVLRASSGTVFWAPVSSVSEVRTPWWRFSTMSAVVDGRRYRFALVSAPRKSSGDVTPAVTTYGGPEAVEAAWEVEGFLGLLGWFFKLLGFVATPFDRKLGRRQWRRILTGQLDVSTVIAERAAINQKYAEQAREQSTEADRRIAAERREAKRKQRERSAKARKKYAKRAEKAHKRQQ